MLVYANLSEYKVNASQTHGKLMSHLTNIWLPILLLQMSSHQYEKKVPYCVCNIFAQLNTQSLMMSSSGLWRITKRGYWLQMSSSQVCGQCDHGWVMLLVFFWSLSSANWTASKDYTCLLDFSIFGMWRKRMPLCDKWGLGAIFIECTYKE